MAFEAGKMIRIKSSSTLVRRDPSTANPYIILADSTAGTCFCVQELPATGLRFAGGIEISENMHTFL